MKIDSLSPRVSMKLTEQQAQLLLQDIQKALAEGIINQNLAKRLYDATANSSQEATDLRKAVLDLVSVGREQLYFLAKVMFTYQSSLPPDPSRELLRAASVITNDLYRACIKLDYPQLDEDLIRGAVELNADILDLHRIVYQDICNSTTIYSNSVKQATANVFTKLFGIKTEGKSGEESQNFTNWQRINQANEAVQQRLFPEKITNSSYENLSFPLANPIQVKALSNYSENLTEESKKITSAGCCKLFFIKKIDHYDRKEIKKQFVDNIKSRLEERNRILKGPSSAAAASSSNENSNYVSVVALKSNHESNHDIILGELNKLVACNFTIGKSYTRLSLFEDELCAGVFSHRTKDLMIQLLGGETQFRAFKEKIKELDEEQEATERTPLIKKH